MTTMVITNSTTLAESFLEMLSSVRNPILYAASFFGIPSALLYCTQIGLILARNQFHNSFYALFLLRAILDLVLMLVTYSASRLPSIAGPLLLPLYRLLPRWALATVFFLLQYTFEADNLATLFLLLNRLSAIAIPLKHEKLWRQFLPLVLLIIYGLPLYFVPYLYAMDMVLIIVEHDPLTSDNRTSFYVSEGANSHFRVDNSFLLFSTSILFFALSFLINLAIFAFYKWKRWELCRQKQQQVQFVSTHTNSQNNGGLDRIERKLLAYTICTFVGHGLITLVMIGFHISFQSGSILCYKAMLAQCPWIFDLGAIVMPSWLLLWASSEFRREWTKKFVPKCLQSAERTSVMAVVPTKIVAPIINRQPNSSTKSAAKP